MIKIKSHGRHVEDVEYNIFYEWVEFPDSGFSFPCNQDGEIQMNDLTSEGLENFNKCESGEYEVIYRGLQRLVNRYYEPAIGECHCGSEVTLSGNSNQCQCGQWYNSAGQQLSDPSHWGEETGEHPRDVMREMDNDIS
jgi:hypothetical protein